MRRFSAQYIITGTGRVLKKGIITTGDDGRITDITDTNGNLPELSNTEFYNGIIVPGLINCHCHLELSAMKGKVQTGTGLGRFIREIRESRPSANEEQDKDIRESDNLMYKKGISACGDICNSSISFGVKGSGNIKYINFLEVFGVDPLKAGKRIDGLLQLKDMADKLSLPACIVPHSFYSMSAALLSKVKELSSENDISTIHFMESEQEEAFLAEGKGGLMNSYSAMGIKREMLYDRIPDHITGLRDYITGSGNLILVHNTFITEEAVRAALERPRTFFCICPGSNIYIENKLPPVGLLRLHNADIVVGTDSLASNKTLDILEELKIISPAFPDIPLHEMIGWATVNGARALNIDNEYGSIEPGKKPGLVLIENIDLISMRLNPGSISRRLI